MALLQALLVSALLASAPATRTAAATSSAPAGAHRVPAVRSQGSLTGGKLGGARAVPGGPRPGGKATSRPLGKKGPRWPTVVLYHVNSHEKLALRLADERGRAVPGLQKRVNRFLRCHHTQAQGKMHPRLVRLIYDIGRHYPGRRIEVVSGFRAAKVARNPRSPHKNGLACDLRVAGIKNTELRDFFRANFQHVGVGYYPNSSFVHLDVRDGASAFWIDYSGPGEGSMYAEDPRADLVTGRAEAFRPTKIDPTWADQAEPIEDVPTLEPSGAARAAAPSDAVSDGPR